MKNQKKQAESTKKRDTTADKKRIKKIFIIIAIVFAVLAIISAFIPVVTDLLQDGYDEVSYNPMAFYEVDYTFDVRTDELYQKQNRSIYYNRYGDERVLTESNVTDISPAAMMFHDYINCIIDGDYSKYPSFFTEECKNNENFKLPAQFTTQGLYDINITLHSSSVAEDEENAVVEIYEVRYRIFKNNGSFRNDILPDETRTLVFELKIKDGSAIINAIAHRTDKTSE